MDITKNTLCELLGVPTIKPNNYFHQAVLYFGDHSYGHGDLCRERQKEIASYPEQHIRLASKPGTSEGRQLWSSMYLAVPDWVPERVSILA